MTKKKFLKILIVMAFLFVGTAALAIDYTFLEPLPGTGGNKLTAGDDMLGKYANILFKFGIGLAVGLAVIKIVIGGVKIMLSGANVMNREDGKQDISSAVWGLVLALAVYLILNTINPDLLDMKINIPPSTNNSSGPSTSSNGGGGGF